MVKKKCGAHRLYIDYRRLNKNIVRDNFPMPLIEDQIDQLSNARVFTVLDFKSLRMDFSMCRLRMKVLSIHLL